MYDAYIYLVIQKNYLKVYDSGQILQTYHKTPTAWYTFNTYDSFRNITCNLW